MTLNQIKQVLLALTEEELATELTLSQFITFLTVCDLQQPLYFLSDELQCEK